ncbi:MAG: phosphate/phosphite/phosphonate ABC transporter substrate-binding protein, partial [Deltaproteobacteria bacterium]|nr:phosphate/phosphite/phosphonate ABC transporter substrate-binding protein [Deltaproteobacteria bacterium]
MNVLCIWGGQKRGGSIIKRYLGLLLVVLMVLAGGAAFAQKPVAELKISAIPDENPQEMLRIYQPFADYLAKEIGIPVKFTPVVDYAATVEGLAAGKLDMVWYGGLTSVQAARRAKGATRIVMRKEDAAFKSHFITRKETGIKSVKDLKGKTFAFGSVGSTSGHLMPRY